MTSGNKSCDQETDCGITSINTNDTQTDENIQDAIVEITTVKHFQSIKASNDLDSFRRTHDGGMFKGVNTHRSGIPAHGHPDNDLADGLEGSGESSFRTHL